jgi:signal peptidase I
MNAVFYRGESMRGTFVDGDYLHVSELDLKDVHPGDVVVFKNLEINNGSGLIVHRVVTIHEGRITTRGDYNSLKDPNQLDAENLIGKVTLCEREGRIHKVAHGFRGLLKALRLRLRLRTKRRLYSLLKPMYLLLKKTRLVPGIWKPELQVITLDSKNGRKIKYIHRGKTVLVRDGKTIIFKRRPYDLLFDI